MIDADGVTLCDHCTWQTYTGNPRVDAQRLASHVATRHAELIPPAEFEDHGSLVGTGQMVTVDWWGQVVAAIAAQPEGAEFTLWDVTKHLPEPPNAAKLRGQVTKAAADLGLIALVTPVKSTRPSVKGSYTGLWRRTDKPAPVRQEARQ